MLQICTLRIVARLESCPAQWAEEPSDLDRMAAKYGSKQSLLARAQRDPAVQAEMQARLRVDAALLAGELEGVKSLISSMAGDLADIKLLLQEDAFLPQGLPVSVRNLHTKALHGGQLSLQDVAVQQSTCHATMPAIFPATLRPYQSRSCLTVRFMPLMLALVRHEASNIIVYREFPAAAPILDQPLWQGAKGRVEPIQDVIAAAGRRAGGR